MRPGFLWQPTRKQASPLNIAIPIRCDFEGRLAVARRVASIVSSLIFQN